MSEHKLCLVRNGTNPGQEMVRQAAQPVTPGESIGAQILNASRNLRLPYPIVRRAWYGRCGYVALPYIRRAFKELQARQGMVLLAGREKREATRALG